MSNTTCRIIFALGCMVAIICICMINEIAYYGEKAGQIEHNAKIKVCQEKEYINTNMCKQLLFGDKVAKIENSERI